MARKLSKTEIKTVAQEIYTRISKARTEKLKKLQKEFEDFFITTEESEALNELENYLGKNTVKNMYGWGNVVQAFKNKAKENYSEDTQLNPKTFTVESITHSISLEQITIGEDFDLDKLINKYIEKYA